MTKILILRHGKAAHNLGDEGSHTFAGSKIDNSLTAEGIDSAHELARQIQNMGGCDLIAASKLKRSRETACIMAKIIDAPVKIINDLQEIDIGDFSGHTKEEVKRLYPHPAEAFYSGDIPHWIFPNGEDYQSVVKRIKSVMNQLADLAKQYPTIAVVGHAMFNRVWFFKIWPDNKDLWVKRPYPHDRIIKLTLNSQELK